jgi:hypothetical protein
MSNSDSKNTVSKVTRRGFFKNLAGLSGLALLAPQIFSSLAQAEEKRGAKKADAGAAGGAKGDLALPLVEPGKDPLAIGVKYQAKVADVKEVELKIERNGVAWGKQLCSGCMLYTKVGSKDGDEVGKCSLFPEKLVKGPGFCASWQKKV